MSGLDEQTPNLRICPCCDEKQDTWSLINNKGEDLGLFNMKKEVIERFDVLNSGYYRSHGAKHFWKNFEGVECSKCYSKIFNVNFLKAVIRVLKENGY